MHMKKSNLHEIAKLVAGLVLGDFLALWWLQMHHGFPITFLGMHFTGEMVAPGLVFDAALFILLVHYGWHIGKTPFLREKTYLIAAGALFAVVAAAHFVRIFTGSDLIIMGWDAPVWLSWIGTAATAYLSYMSFHLSLKVK
jgi:hypothetical protein